MRLVTEILMEKAQEEQQQYRGHLTTVSNIYDKDTPGLELALATLRKALTKSGKQLKEKLDKRKSFLASTKIPDETLLLKMGLCDPTKQQPPRRDPTPPPKGPFKKPQPPKRQRSPSPYPKGDHRGPRKQSRQGKKPYTRPNNKGTPSLTFAEMTVLQNILKKHQNGQ
jgi:hypothetical protein